jgi:L-threonylcarbamoyladenylate synthase
MTTFTNEMPGMVSYHEIEEAVEALRTGGLILYPTDTVWSIGCDATDPVAIERTFNLKGRRSTEDFEVLVPSIDMLKRYVDHLHPKLETLLLYHVRPLTIVFENARNLPGRLTAPGRRIAVRLTQDDFCRALTAAYDRPLIATPAHAAGHPLPSTFGSISSSILEGVDYVTKHRQHEKKPGEPSVMVKLSRRDELVFLRE